MVYGYLRISSITQNYLIVNALQLYLEKQSEYYLEQISCPSTQRMAYIHGGLHEGWTHDCFSSSKWRKECQRTLWTLRNSTTSMFLPSKIQKKLFKNVWVFLVTILNFALIFWYRNRMNIKCYLFMNLPLRPLGYWNSLLAGI